VSRSRVLLLETIAEEADAELRASADVVLAASPSEADCLAAAGAFGAIMTRGKGRVTAALLDACSGVRVAARCGVGLDNVDVPAASARGVRVLNLPGCNALTMAEHTIMLMLAVGRGLVPLANSVAGGDWASRNRYDRDELHDKTVGVVGLGRIGRRVAEICRAMGMGVVYTDEHAAAEFERLALGDLLERADVVTLHCPLTDGTRGMIDAGALARMKPGAILINTARGALIDEDALVAALSSGRLGGFGADVLTEEPPAAGHPLLSLANVVITPHAGALTRSTYTDSCVRSVRNVLAVLAGREAEAGCVFNATALASVGG